MPAPFEFQSKSHENMELITEENSIYKDRFPRETKTNQPPTDENTAPQTQGGSGQDVPQNQQQNQSPTNTSKDSATQTQKPKFSFFKMEIISDDGKRFKQDLRNKARANTQEDSAGALQHMLNKIREETEEHNSNLQPNDAGYISYPYSTLVEEEYEMKIGEGPNEKTYFSYEGLGSKKTKRDERYTGIQINAQNGQSFSKCLNLWEHKTVGQAVNAKEQFLDKDLISYLFTGKNSQDLQALVGENWPDTANKTIYRRYFENRPSKTLLIEKTNYQGSGNSDANSYQCFPSKIKVPYKDEQTKQTKEASYSLKSMICRTSSGSNSYGHYVTFVHHKDDQWIELNDSGVTLYSVTGNFDELNWIEKKDSLFRLVTRLAPYKAYYERDDVDDELTVAEVISNGEFPNPTKRRGSLSTEGIGSRSSLPVQSRRKSLNDLPIKRS